MGGGVGGGGEQVDFYRKEVFTPVEVRWQFGSS